MEIEIEAEDPRAKTARENGAAGGCPPGTEQATKRTYSKLDEATADAIMTGRPSPLTIRGSGDVTEDDRRTIARISRMPAEEFVLKLTERLQSHAIRVSDRIGEKLEGEPDKLKLNDLTFLLSVCVDKLQAIGNRAATQGQAVGTQINIFGSDATRAAVLASLRQESGKTVNVTANQVEG